MYGSCYWKVTEKQRCPPTWPIPIGRVWCGAGKKPLFVDSGVIRRWKAALSFLTVTPSHIPGNPNLFVRLNSVWPTVQTVKRFITHCSPREAFHHALLPPWSASSCTAPTVKRFITHCSPREALHRALLPTNQQYKPWSVSSRTAPTVKRFITHCSLREALRHALLPTYQQYKPWSA